MIIIMKTNNFNLYSDIKIKKVKYVDFSSQGTTPVNQTSLTDWQMAVRRDSAIVLHSIKFNNVDSLDQIHYFLIK